MSEEPTEDIYDSPLSAIDTKRREIERTKAEIDELSRKLKRNLAFSIVLLTLAPLAFALGMVNAPMVAKWVFILAAIIFAFGGLFSLSEHRENINSIDAKTIHLSSLRDQKKYARMHLEESFIAIREASLWSYHSEVAATIDEYRSSARYYRTVHNRFQFFIIIASSLVTLIATASASISGLEWGAAALSFLVASATGITGYFKFRERAVNLQRTADELEREYNSVEIGINEYSRSDIEETRVMLQKFAERSEEIKNEQRKREQQLEQSPEARSQSRDGGI